MFAHWLSDRQDSGSRHAARPGLRCLGKLRCHYWPLAAFALSLLLAAGCASGKSRRQLEQVAKGWCETIRASQVIPVYPLTEDLSPGDVFLVQTPIASQAKLYKERGFLALDDRRTRLKGLDYGRVYFDGYWDWGKEFAATPHTPPNRVIPGQLTADNPGTNVFLQVAAPRVAFPTYTFEGQSSFGLSLAIPVQGIPVALNFLQADRVDGTVTILDARTYAADEQQLYASLRSWAGADEVQQILDETVRRASPDPIFLRVVSRVYLAGGVIVSLNRSSSAGGQGRGGFNPPEVPSVLDEAGNVNTGYTNLLHALSATAKSPLSDLTDSTKAGGSVRFVAASQSSVGLSEAFDRLLAIGYLGFDVPVYAGGVLGAPLPTFQLLDRSVTTPPVTRVGDLTQEQAGYEIALAALSALTTSDPQAGLRVMAGVAHRLLDKAFAGLEESCETALKAPEDQLPGLARDVLTEFIAAADPYVSTGGSTGLNYQRFDDAFVRAYKDRQLH